MRVGVAYVDVRVNMIKYKKDLGRLERLASESATKVNASLGRIGTGYSRLGKSSAGAATGMNKVSKAATKQSKSLLGMIPHVAAVTISYMAMRTAWRAVLSGLGAGVQFEKKMAVVKAVSRATEEQFLALGAAARKMAADTVFTATETADALKFLAMAGFDAKESIQALPGVLNLALIGELELGRATDIATDTLKAFGLQAHDITRVTDVMVSVITRSNTNIEMMGQSMKFAAPLARALGYEIEEVSAMIGVLATAGIKAGIAGRGLQQSFVRTQKAAAAMGLDIGSGLINVLKAYKREQEEIEKVTNKVIAREKIAAKIKKDYGLIAAKSVFILKDNIKEYERLSLAAHLSAKETELAALIMQDTVDASYKRLKSIIAEISISVFSEYKDNLKAMFENTIQWFKDNQTGIEDWSSGLIDSLRAVKDMVSLSISGWSMLYDEIKKTYDLGDGEGAGFWDILRAYSPAALAKQMANINYLREHPEAGSPKLGTPDFDDPKAIIAVREEIEKLVTANKIWEAVKLKIASKEALETIAETTRKVIMLGFAYEGFTSDVEDNASVLRRQQKEAYDKLPPSLRKIYEEFQKIADVRYLAEEQIKKAGVWDPAMIKKLVDETERLYKQKGKDIIKAVEKVKKYEEKTAVLSAKTAEDKFEAQRVAAYQWLDIQLEIYNRDVAASEKAGLTKERIWQASNDRIQAINAAQAKKTADDAVKAQAKAERDAAKALRQKASDAKALVDIQRDLLAEMTRNDEGYFALLAIIRKQEFAILRDKYKGDDREKYDEILRDVGIAVGKRDARERALKTDDVFAGMGVGWAEYMDGLQTWADQGKAIFDEFASASESAISDTLFRAIKGDLDSFTDIWYAFLETMLKAFTDSMAQMLQQWIMDDMVKSLGGGIKGLIGLGASFFTGSIAGGGGNAISGADTMGGVYHRGGIVGETPVQMRLVPSDIFKGARRLHEGLMPDEFPAILQRGETVFPKGDNVFQRTSSEGVRTPKGGDGASAGDGLQSGGDKYDVNIHAVDARSFSDLMERNPGAVLTTINRALEKNPTGRHKLKRMVS